MEGAITLEHGSGGRLMRELLEEVILPSYKLNKVPGGLGLPEMDDGAFIPLGDFKLILTTDAYTVKPIFFPGGDIGRLAACGTINDLAVMGAKPIALATSLVVEEGFGIDDLKRITNSINEVCVEVGVPLVAGDTKVMEKGEVDKIVIGACGLGLAERVITDAGLRPGDKVIITGTIGDHHIALLSVREGLSFDVPISSDVAPLWETVRAALELGGVSAMKDPTRGGVAGALNEMARKSGVDVWLQEAELPIRDEVRSASEMLGLDPLELTNEGIAIIGVRPDLAEETLEAIRSTRYGRDAAIVGEAREGEGRVVLETLVGGKRLVREPMGAPVPRIC
mgnify:CR=1 FL=1